MKMCIALLENTSYKVFVKTEIGTSANNIITYFRIFLHGHVRWGRRRHGKWAGTFQSKYIFIFLLHQ